MTVAPKHPAARAQILAAVSSAKEEWPGLTWDSAPQTLLAAVIVGRAIGTNDLTDGLYWPDDGSREAQALREAWRALVSEVTGDEEIGLGRRVKYTTKVFAEAKRLAEAEAAHVEQAAERAAAHGDLIVELVGAGQWPEACHHAEQAAAIERMFGDSPSWGRLVDEIKALPEWIAADTAIVDYHDDVSDVSEAAAIERCGAVISVIPQHVPTAPDAREAWCTRFVATYRAEIAADAAKE